MIYVPRLRCNRPLRLYLKAGVFATHSRGTGCFLHDGAGLWTLNPGDSAGLARRYRLGLEAQVSRIHMFKFPYYTHCKEEHHVLCGPPRIRRDNDLMPGQHSYGWILVSPGRLRKKS